MSNENSHVLGFAQSDIDSDTTDTVGSGESATATLDLGRQYAFVRVFIDSCDNIASSTTMSFTFSPVAEPSSGDILYQVWDFNGSAQLTTGTLPTTDTPISFLIQSMIGIRRIVCTFSNNCTGDVVVKVQGVESGINID